MSLWDRANILFARIFRKREVSKDDFLYRRIHPDWQRGPSEISSAAFRDEQMSVDLASLSTPNKSWRRGPSEWGLARIPVDLMTKLKIAQDVRHWPTIPNWSHSLVIGKKTKAVGKEIRASAEILVHVESCRPRTQVSDRHPTT